MPGPRAKRQKVEYDPEEEARLEKLVFGDGKDVIENLERADAAEDVEDVDEEEQSEDEEEESGNEEERSGDESGGGEDNDDSSEVESIHEEEEKGVAWVDEDDEKCTIDGALRLQDRRPPGNVKHRPEKYYTEYLQNKFTKLVGTPKWAEIKRSEDEDSDSDHEILKHSNHLAPTKVKKLPKGLIEIKALRNINNDTQNEGPLVTNLQFHPTSTVAFVTGLSGIVSVFQIDGTENTKLQSIKFDRFPVNCAKFLKEGSEILLGTRSRNYFQSYDLMSGKTYKIQLPHDVTNAKKFEVSPDGKFVAVTGRTGEIHLLTGRTKELITTLRMNKRCRALSFTPDSNNLITHGDSEEMYIWDVNSRRCKHRAVDDGCMAAGALSVSQSGQFLATGSKQGVVNIYDAKAVLESKYPQPLKIVMNLVTPITSLKFNPTSEILAMASNHKKNAFKLLHLPSFNVFSNFPTFQTVMHHPEDIDFSPRSGYLGVSNNKNNAYLYRLKHYGNY